MTNYSLNYSKTSNLTLKLSNCTNFVPLSMYFHNQSPLINSKFILTNFQSQPQIILQNSIVIKFHK